MTLTVTPARVRLAGTVVQLAIRAVEASGASADITIVTGVHVLASAIVLAWPKEITGSTGDVAMTADIARARARRWSERNGCMRT